MTRKIKITSDTTCDLSDKLCKQYDIELIPLHIVYGSESYDDRVNIFPKDILERYDSKKELPKTAAVSVWEYTQLFKKFTDEGYEVVHINLGSAISSSHQNAVAAASEFSGVYAVDSQNLSVGTGMLVLKAAEMVENTELSAKEIAEEISKLTAKVHMSFVIDNLEFLRAGGRCSTLAMLGANLLSIKPCIEVDNTKGSAMTIGRKYRGKLDKVVPQYTREKLSQYSKFDKERAFLVGCGSSDELYDTMREILESLGVFSEIISEEASCTISSHCGAGTIGVCFMTE